MSSLKNQTSSQIAVIKTEELINKEHFKQAARPTRKPNDRTARSMGRGFGTPADAERQLIQDLLLSKEQIEAELVKVVLHNTPSSSGNYLNLKQRHHKVTQEIQALTSLNLAGDSSTRRQTS